MRRTLLGLLAAVATAGTVALATPRPAAAASPSYWIVRCVGVKTHSAFVINPQDISVAVSACVARGGHPTVQPVFKGGKDQPDNPKK